MISIGIDSHRDSLAVCVLDEQGVIIAEREFANAPTGHRALRRFLVSLPGMRRIGIEGSGGYGGACAEHLRRGGEHVYEVPGARTRRERRHLARPGKSDAVDAEAIARVVASGARLSASPRPAAASELKLLCDERDALARERTRYLNRLHALSRRYMPGYLRQVGSLRTTAGRDRLAVLLSSHEALWARLAERHAARIAALEIECRELAACIAAGVAEAESGLTEICGVAALTAARLLGEVGDVGRFRSKAAFAMGAGVAPIPASSGRTQRVRLNRGGNRRLNHALHNVALVQARRDPRARAYLDRKRAQGMSKREALRCLKRQLANVVYATMVRDAARGVLTT
jgi:transposase